MRTVRTTIWLENGLETAQKRLSCSYSLKNTCSNTIPNLSSQGLYTGTLVLPRKIKSCANLSGRSFTALQSAMWKVQSAHVSGPHTRVASHCPIKNRIRTGLGSPLPRTRFKQPSLFVCPPMQPALFVNPQLDRFASLTSSPMLAWSEDRKPF
jgi:hypothetical protein